LANTGRSICQASSHLADERRANAQADVRKASDKVTEANQLMGRAQQQVHLWNIIKQNNMINTSTYFLHQGWFTV
jgi:hypothetical protein